MNNTLGNITRLALDALDLYVHQGVEEDSGDVVEVIYWPDGLWCFNDGYIPTNFSWMCEDLRTIKVPASMSWDDVDAEIKKLTKGASNEGEI